MSLKRTCFEMRTRTRAAGTWVEMNALDERLIIEAREVAGDAAAAGSKSLSIPK